jgi:hypothetical protein
MVLDIKTFEEYIENFLKGVADTVDVDYSIPASVKKNNKGVDLYRKSVRLIDEYYPDRLNEFAKLMESDLPKVSLCCAVSLLDLTEHYTKEQETLALNIITDIAEKYDGAEKYGWSIWLKRYKERKNQNIENSAF